MEASLSSETHSQSVIELPMCNVSIRKRNESDLDDSKQAKKKRRSSLSYHRRSITYSSPVSEEESHPNEGAGVTDHTEMNKPSETGLLPNPDNIQMDVVIADMNAQIEKMEMECQQWRKLLLDMEEKEKQSKDLSMNLTLSMTDVNDDLKQLAMSCYVLKEPLDLLATKKELDRMLLQLQFNRESCIKDVSLIHSVVQTQLNRNKKMAAELVDCRLCGPGDQPLETIDVFSGLLNN